MRSTRSTSATTTFPSTARAELAAALVRTAPGDLQYAVFAASGSEAIEIAIKTARHATKRRAVVSIQKGYHGHTGLALAAGDERAAALFLSQGPAGEFVHVPFNDLAAMEDALRAHDVAAVVLETIPATVGFPMPEAGYLPAVKALCARYGAVYVADEVQTGLGRTGALWASQTFRRRAGHSGDRQGTVGRHLPHRRRAAQPAGRRLAA